MRRKLRIPRICTYGYIPLEAVATIITSKDKERRLNSHLLSGIGSGTSIFTDFYAKKYCKTLYGEKEIKKDNILVAPEFYELTGIEKRIVIRHEIAHLFQNKRLPRFLMEYFAAKHAIKKTNIYNFYPVPVSQIPIIQTMLHFRKTKPMARWLRLKILYHLYKTNAYF